MKLENLIKVLKNNTLIFGIFFIHILWGEEKASIEVNLNLVSNYIWRGHDFFRNYALQNQKPYSSYSGTWAFQPSITWNTPVEGLYTNLFSSIALQGRNDKDIDKRIQKLPGGPFIQNRTSLLDYLLIPGIDLQSDIITEMPSSNKISDYDSNSELFPNFYKERVGLKRADELDITIGYQKETKIGGIGFGILHYKYANLLQVGSPYGTEIFIKYSLPKIPNLSFSIYEDIMVHTIYYSIGYSGSYELSKDLSSSYSVSTGYYVLNKVQGISDITLNYTVSHSSGFSIGFNVALTPDRRIQEYYWNSGDPVTGEVILSKLPVDLNGLSSIYDGKVADPSKNLGPVNEYINGLISQKISSAIGIPYTYIPRQKLPSYYWWISLGYNLTFE